jgi:hypothetical protein
LNLQNEPRWNQTQVDAFQRVMDAFEGYENIGGFFVGNEVITKGMPCSIEATLPS